MTYYEKSEDWLHQSALLLDARPETTRVTTTYKLKPAWRRAKKEGAAASDAATTKPPRGYLVLKTYDPKSGVALKYKTAKAAEVSRLVQMLGTLGRRMAALPPVKEEEKMTDAATAYGGDAAGSGVQTPVPGPSAQAALGPGQQQGGGKGKKKKGKR